MSNTRLNELKKEYMGTPIPENLYSIIDEQIKNIKLENKKKYSFKRRLNVALVSILSFVLLINVSPAFAETISRVPVLSHLVKLVTVREYIIKKDGYDARIKVPEIQGLDDKNLEKRINENFNNEGRKLYEELNKEVNLNKVNNKYVSTDYVVKSETDNRLSIEMEKLEIEASGYTTKKHFNIDKNKKIILTLPMLFKDEKYIDVISQNIKVQMREQMKKDSNKVYFIDQDEGGLENFSKIDKNQDFYINDKNQLVISFDEYEVAPGYMGAIEFVIPDDVLNEL
ncbi:DUF3298 and DUF4163 domain-containing protein [Clostridioides mangenotii]|uniref:DUF3298 and DUF4163 domain-containing protein n=1 Tax=Metaclostridioides mangenotii TaxID=1540 RepID=UPI002149E550|nr:DUF3298 and DUF4163 domain-containing protein [Clostridioides mangenotii]MCR1955540.1 DUF3298 and DUF4163 domain-containing protein [Clostridioides mangenotii]